MIKFCVIYQGRPEDPEKFDHYYWHTHLSIIARWPKVRQITVSRCRQLNEDIYMIAEFCFDNLEDLDRAITSPERQEAAADRLKFPTFYGTIHHQILEMKEYPVPQ